jgi:hypothetical protein
MANYSARVATHMDERTLVLVTSPLTRYMVEVEEEELTLRGPGVEEVYYIGPGKDIPEGLSSENRALLAVLLWEDQV